MMKKGDMPPPLPKLRELLIREFQTIKHDTNFIRTQRRCIVLPLTTLTHKHGLIKADLSFRNL